jgi:hypothetical protein
MRVSSDEEPTTLISMAAVAALTDPDSIAIVYPQNDVGDHLWEGGIITVGRMSAVS